MTTQTQLTEQQAQLLTVVTDLATTLDASIPDTTVDWRIEDLRAALRRLGTPEQVARVHTYDHTRECLMTLDEARYVLAHREMYDDATYHYALDIVEQADRQERRHG